VTVRGRWAVAISVLAAVTALTLLCWPRPADPVDVVGQAGPHQVRLLIETPAVGVHDLTLDVTGAVERLVVAPAMVEMGHAIAPVTATPAVFTRPGPPPSALPSPAVSTHPGPPPSTLPSPAVPGRFKAPAVEFLMPGRWDVTVTVHGPDGTDEVVLPVLIAPRGRES
jgi:hypothetical protein